MRRTQREPYLAFFSIVEKEALVGLAETHQTTMIAVLRSLILREAASRTLIHHPHTASHEKVSAGGDR